MVQPTCNHAVSGIAVMILPPGAKVFCAGATWPMGPRPPCRVWRVVPPTANIAMVGPLPCLVPSRNLLPRLSQQRRVTLEGYSLGAQGISRVCSHSQAAWVGYDGGGGYGSSAVKSVIVTVAPEPNVNSAISSIWSTGQPYTSTGQSVGGDERV